MSKWCQFDLSVRPIRNFKFNKKKVSKWLESLKESVRHEKISYFDGKKPSFSRKNTAFQSTGITATQIPVFGIDLNTGIPVLGIGIAIPSM